MTQVRPFAKNLEHLIHKNRLTLKELAELCGSKKSTIFNWSVTGRPRDPYMLLNLAKIFNLSIEELLTKDLSSTDGGRGPWNQK